MRRLPGSSIILGTFLATSILRPSAADELSIQLAEIDAVGDLARDQLARKALQDTIWIADWSFDGGVVCDETGWVRVDNRILNDGSVYWSVTSAFAGSGGISGHAAALGYSGSVCCVAPAGYDDDWYQAIRIDYTGPATLTFDYLLDSQTGGDFLRVESDSLCGSFARVDYGVAPGKRATSFRRVEFSTSGLNQNGVVQSLPLRDYGPGTHCVYIAFFSNGQTSPCDGGRTSTLGAGLVVDDLVILDSGGTRSEDFEDGILNLGAFVNVQDSEPFGEWARTYRHLSDNDLCTENTGCAWLWTDHTTPTMANDPSMAFGPGGYVVRNWLDDIIVSPWVSFAGTPGASGTSIRYRRFPGNPYPGSRIIQSWSVRGKDTVDGTTCISQWGHTSQWNSLGDFRWMTLNADLSPYFDATSSWIQIRFRTSDWQWISGASPPSSFIPGPGPYLDRIQIGRRVLRGPVITEGVDARYQAQDAFPTEILPTAPGTGEHFRPSTDRFGTCAFSAAQDYGIVTSWNLITGDSIIVSVVDVRGAGGVTSVEWYGAIIEGPHAGKAPAPYTVGPNGFVTLSALTRPGSRSYFVDLDDTYFRGGDVLYYFWLAQDGLGGLTSDPAGLEGVPTSVAAAEEATGGLLEVSFLPAIDWDPAYLARIAADAHGDLVPTLAEITASSQRNCMLYVQMVNLRRLSGTANRTSFMYTLDRLGYEGHYDVYDLMGLGDTNNHLGGRASVEQAEGYSLIVYDAGNMSPGGPIMPDGSDKDTQKIDQVGWFRDWLAQAPTSEAGFATLWILGSEVLEERPTAALYTSDMGVSLQSTNQALNLNPQVDGVASFTFDRGSGQAGVDFTSDLLQLHGGCPSIRDYDALGTTGTAVTTHRYRDPVNGTLGGGAIVMNRNNAENWNTIFQSHPWLDIRDLNGTPSSPAPESVLLDKVLDAVLRSPCLHDPNPTDAELPDGEIDTPRETVLHPNVPNPFNPTTTIRFDLAHRDRVSLRIYDVAGRLVRTLVDDEREAGRNLTVVWDGLDREGRPVASGLYLCRLETTDVSVVHKMLALK